MVRRWRGAHGGVVAANAVADAGESLSEGKPAEVQPGHADVGGVRPLRPGKRAILKGRQELVVIHLPPLGPVYPTLPPPSPQTQTGTKGGSIRFTRQDAFRTNQEGWLIVFDGPLLVMPRSLCPGPPPSPTRSPCRMSKRQRC